MDVERMNCWFLTLWNRGGRKTFRFFGPTSGMFLRIRGTYETPGHEIDGKKDTCELTDQSQDGMGDFTNAVLIGRFWISGLLPRKWWHWLWRVHLSDVEESQLSVLRGLARHSGVALKSHVHWPNIIDSRLNSHKRESFTAACHV